MFFKIVLAKKDEKEVHGQASGANFWHESVMHMTI
jgi:hypothetical protein